MPLPAGFTVAAPRVTWSLIPSFGHGVVGGTPYRRWKLVSWLASASVTQSTIAQGTPDFGGGAFVSDGQSSTFTASTFTGNTATTGGAIANNCGALTLTNDTLTGNHAAEFGGAIDQTCLLEDLAATSALDFVTLADNTGGFFRGQSGSTIANLGDTSTMTVHDTIIAKKSGDTGADCFLFAGARLTSQGYNLESADDCSLHATGDQTKIDPQLGPLASNGGRRRPWRSPPARRRSTPRTTNATSRPTSGASAGPSTRAAAATSARSSCRWRRRRRRLPCRPRR